MVRFDTYNASAHLVRQLEASGKVEVVHDGGDNLLVTLTATGEQVSIYLIETVIPPYEIKLALEDNHKAGIHTLFILWGEMHLPEPGTIYIPDDWITVLFNLYGDKVYAFGVYGKDIHIFPVFFDKEYGYQRQVRYGDDVKVEQLGCSERVISQFHEFRGTWRIADFEYTGEPKHKQRSHGQPKPAAPPAKRSPYEVLGVTPQTDLETIKREYRRLARVYHPDLNPAKDTTKQMQTLNEAYTAILAAIEAVEASNGD